MEPTPNVKWAAGFFLSGLALLVGAGATVGWWLALLIAGIACLVLGVAIGRNNQ